MSFTTSVSTEPVILGPGEGPLVRIPGHPFVVKASSEDTRGAYALAEVTITGDGPPQHIHRAEEEAFYILEGEVDIQVGTETVHGTSGTFVLIPRGTVHTFWNVGTGPARMLAIASPPGIDAYLAEAIGDEEIDTATFIERISAVADRYQFEVVGPPRG